MPDDGTVPQINPRCAHRWERQKPGIGHPHRCIRETDHAGPHWCSCGASDDN